MRSLEQDDVSGGQTIERLRADLVQPLADVLGDGLSLQPIAEESVDVCVSIVVFQHFPDPEIAFAYVRELGRVLRPCGWAALQVSNDPAAHRPLAPCEERCGR